MSLINEALKKTQSATSRPTVSAFPADEDGRRSSGIKARHIIQLVIGLSILSGLITGIGGLLVYLFVFSKADVGSPLDRAQAALTIMEEVMDAPPPAASSPTSTPAASSIPLVAEQAEIRQLYADVAGDDQTGTTHVTEQTPDVAAAPAGELEQVVEADPEPAKARQALVADYVRSLEVRGVMRGSGKVLLYLPNESRTSSFSSSETVNFELGLTLLRITENTLIFTDDGGHEHIKRF